MTADATDPTTEARESLAVSDNFGAARTMLRTEGLRALLEENERWKADALRHVDEVQFRYDKTLIRAEAAEAELAEAHTHFAIQEGRVREAVERARAAEANEAGLIDRLSNCRQRALKAEARIAEALEAARNGQPTIYRVIRILKGES